MKGIIYKYTSPDGKVYIGQTCREQGRKCDFKEINRSYSGTKIDVARREIGAENFQYEVLFSFTSENKDEVKEILNEKEQHYIALYKANEDEFGYNMSIGGLGNKGYALTTEGRLKIGANSKRWIQEKGHPLQGKHHRPESIEKMRQNTQKKFGKDNPNYGWKPPRELIDRLAEMSKQRKGELNPFYGRHHTDEVKDFLRNKFGREVLQIDAKTYQVIAKFKSSTEASESLNKGKKGASDICKVCNKSVLKNGVQRITAYGYRWKWADDTDTTFAQAKTSPPPSFKGCHLSENQKELISKINSKKVKQIDFYTGELIAIYDSVKKACIALGKPKSGGDIGKMCNGKSNSSKVLGYKWEWV